MEEKVQRLTVYEQTLQSLFEEGYCRGIISKKKIKILLGKLHEEKKSIGKDKTLTKIK